MAILPSARILARRAQNGLRWASKRNNTGVQLGRQENLINLEKPLSLAGRACAQKRGLLTGSNVYYNDPPRDPR
jgi:hypothetical protein